MAIGLGIVALGSVALSLVWPEPFFKLSQRFVTDPAWAERAFGRAAKVLPQTLTTPAMFWGYEAQGLLRLGLAALAAGVALLGLKRWPLIAVAVVIVELYSVHGRFLGIEAIRAHRELTARDRHHPLEALVDSDGHR